MLRGRTMDDLLNVVGNIKMISDIKTVVKELKQKNYMVGIISSSYTLITNYVKQNIGADFSLAYNLEFKEGRTTGEVNIPSYFFGSPESLCGHAICKTNALLYACEKYNVLPKNCLVIGDSKEDRCMIAHAGKGVAFCTEDEILKKVAVRSIKEKSFESLLAMA